MGILGRTLAQAKGENVTQGKRIWSPSTLCNPTPVLLAEAQSELGKTCSAV